MYSYVPNSVEIDGEVVFLALSTDIQKYKKTFSRNSLFLSAEDSKPDSSTKTQIRFFTIAIITFSIP